MKVIIQEYLYKALKNIVTLEINVEQTTIPIEYARTPKHGDFSSSIALVLSKSLNTSPVSLAHQIVEQLNHSLSDQENIFEKIEVIQPGFINFFVRSSVWLGQLAFIIQQGEQYGRSNIGEKKRLLVEFVSSNPTGPLHIGHGRAASHGDILARLLKTIGYQVATEYYINDAGRQMDILGCSIWLRYLEAQGAVLDFPTNAYQGSYVLELAKNLQQHYGDSFYHPTHSSINSLKNDSTNSVDKEQRIDQLIAEAKTLLGKERYAQLVDFGLNYILEDIQEDLTEFGVNFDRWFSEKSLIEANKVQKTIQALTDNGHTYQEDGNLWFRSTTFGDDKDRVLLRKNGQPTYFAVDAAYRMDVLENRSFNTMINLLGADHHGYLARIHAVIQALGYKKEKIIFCTLQIVSLYRHKEKLPLSTRSGEFITLRALREEVGLDAARLFFILRKSSQTIDFDLELAKSHSHQNPVYYLQYAYTRILSVMRQLKAKRLTWSVEAGLHCTDKITLDEELQLIKQLAFYPDAIQQAATQYEPTILLQYLRELAKQFHAYYNHTPILNQEASIRSGRLTLLHAVQVVLKNGFDLLGIRTLEKM